MNHKMHSHGRNFLSVVVEILIETLVDHGYIVDRGVVKDAHMVHELGECSRQIDKSAACSRRRERERERESSFIE